MNKNFLKNVFGYSKIKEELYLIQHWYFDSDKLGDKKKLLPKGILFYGDPGEGKTHLMREYSKSFNYPIFIIQGNDDNLEDEIISRYNLARKEKYAIVIIDEVDNLIDKDQKIKRVLQSQLDGFNNEGNILTLATANNFYDLPESLLREGRFDRKFKICPKDKNDFNEIIKGFSLDCKLSLNDDEISEITDYLSQYSISSVKAAFNNASLRYGPSSSVNDILNALDFIQTGFINKNGNFKIKRSHALHEAGHAVYLYFFSNHQEFLRIYFDNNAGNTVYKELGDIRTDETILETLRCSLAGLAAEEIILKKHGIGCYEDLKKAHELAFNLLVENSYEKVDYIASPRHFYRRDDISSYQSKIYDVRVARFIRKNFRYVKHRLKKYKKEICLLSDYLLTHQSIQKNELASLFNGGNTHGN